MDCSTEVNRRLIYHQAAPNMEARLFKIKSSNDLANTITSLLHLIRCLFHSLPTFK